MKYKIIPVPKDSVMAWHGYYYAVVKSNGKEPVAVFVEEKEAQSFKAQRELGPPALQGHSPGRPEIIVDPETAG